MEATLLKARLEDHAAHLTEILERLMGRLPLGESYHLIIRVRCMTVAIGCLVEEEPTSTNRHQNFACLAQDTLRGVAEQLNHWHEAHWIGDGDEQQLIQQTQAISELIQELVHQSG